VSLESCIRAVDRKKPAIGGYRVLVRELDSIND
jgi:hypothetical protein